LSEFADLVVGIDIHSAPIIDWLLWWVSGVQTMSLFFSFKKMMSLSVSGEELIQKLKQSSTADRSTQERRNGQSPRASRRGRKATLSRGAPAAQGNRERVRTMLAMAEACCASSATPSCLLHLVLHQKKKNISTP